MKHYILKKRFDKPATFFYCIDFKLDGVYVIMGSDFRRAEKYFSLERAKEFAQILSLKFGIDTDIMCHDPVTMKEHQYKNIDISNTAIGTEFIDNKN